MVTTTDYGTWCNHGDRYNLTVEATVCDAINGGDNEWQERVQSTGAFDRIVSDYRDAIDAALPEGVTLAGDQFYGPYYEADWTWDGELDIAGLIEAIDLYEIVARHDPDNA